MLTPLRPGTFNEIQLDAGAFFIGIDPSTYKSVAAMKSALESAIGDDTKCLGASRGGGSFQVTRETREVEADGKRYSFVGSTIVDSQDAFLSTTLIEITPGNIKRALSTADSTVATDTTSSDKTTSITPRTSIKDSDYIETLCWVGETRQGYLAIVLQNAINKADFNMTINDKGEAELAVEFHATMGGVNDFDTPPYRIYRLDKAAVGPGG